MLDKIVAVFISPDDNGGARFSFAMQVRNDTANRDMAYD